MFFSQQQPPALDPTPLKQPAASIEAHNYCAPLQCMPLFSVKKNPPFVQPHANPVLPEETLFSYKEKLYQSPTIPKPSSHEELPYTRFDTKEMSSSLTTSEMPTHSALSFISSTSNTSSNDNVWSGRELMRPPSNKPCKEKQSRGDSNVPGTSSRNGSACGGTSKKTLMASGAAASDGLKKVSQLSLRTKGKHKCAVCMLLCEHINELYGSKNGGKLFE